MARTSLFEREKVMSAMFTPLSPKSVPYRPTTPGLSSLMITTPCPAGFSSMR